MKKLILWLSILSAVLMAQTPVITWKGWRGDNYSIPGKAYVGDSLVVDVLSTDTVITNVIKSADTINVVPNGETDDYFNFIVASGVPKLSTYGGSDKVVALIVTSSDGNVQIIAPDTVTFKAGGDVSNYLNYIVSSSLPMLQAIGGANNTNAFKITVDDGNIQIVPTDSLRLEASGDADDYLSLTVASNVVRLLNIGGANNSNDFVIGSAEGNLMLQPADTLVIKTVGDAGQYLQLYTATNLPTINGMGSGNNVDAVNLTAGDGNILLTAPDTLKIKTTAGTYRYVRVYTSSNIPTFQAVGGTDKVTALSFTTDDGNLLLSPADSITTNKPVVIGIGVLPDNTSGAYLGTAVFKFVDIFSADGDFDSTWVGVLAENIDANQKMVSDLGTLKTDSVTSNSGNLLLSGLSTGIVEVTDTLDVDDISNSAAVEIRASGDNDDYINMSTTTNLPAISGIGGTDKADALKITTDDGNLYLSPADSLIIDKPTAFEGQLLKASVGTMPSTIPSNYTAITAFDDGSSVRLAVTKDDAGTETSAYMAEMTDALNAFVAGLPYYVGDGTDDYLYGADDSKYEMGLGDFSFYALIRLSDYTPSAAVTIARHANGTDFLGWILTLGTDGKLTLALGNAANFTTYAYTSTLAVRHTDNYPALVGFSADRDGNVTFYDWFGSLGTAVMSGSSAQTVTCTTAEGFKLFQNVNATTEYDFRAIWKARYFNLALSYADMMGTNKCLLPYKYVGANQTVKNVSTCVNETYGTFDGASATGFHVVGGASTQRCHTADELAFVYGKTYRVSFTFALASGQSPRIAVRNNDGGEERVPIFADLGALTNGNYSYTYSSQYTETALLQFYTTAATEYTISNLSIIQIGAVLGLNPSGMQAGVWKDASGNGLDGTVTGAILTNSEADYVMGNNTPEDSDGGRESDIRAYGVQSGGEKTTLGYMRFSHDGAVDDEKGKFQVYLNDTNDGNTPSVNIFTALSSGNVGEGTTTPQHQHSIVGASAALNVVDTDVNINRTSAAQATDSSSIKLDVSGTPIIQISGVDGDQYQISINTSDEATLTNAAGLTLNTGTALKVGTTQWDVTATDSINGAVIAAGTIPATGLALQKDIVLGGDASGNVDNVLPGTDGDATLTVAVSDDSHAHGTTTISGLDFGDDITNGAGIESISGLTEADVSVLECTADNTYNVVTSGGNNYILGSNAGNTALEFKTPASVLSEIGAQASDATLTDIADGTIAENLVNTANPWADNEVADNITATSYLLLTAFDDSLDFTIGATPNGDLGGTWILPSVDDDSHAHTSSTISGLDSTDVSNLRSADFANADYGDISVTAGLFVIDTDFEEEVTEGSLADATIVGADIKNGTITYTDVTGFVFSFEGWITYVHGAAPDTITLGVLPANALVTNINIWTYENFNADGTDLLRVGYASVPEAYATDVDVSSTGVETWTPGASAKIVDATSRTVQVTCYSSDYTNKSQGKVHVVMNWIQATVAP